jgi:hypothetical protein
VQIAKTSTSQAFSANLTIADVDDAGFFCILISSHCVVVGIDVARVATSVRQHFLKRDDVFFNVLGVFGMKCISIPGLHEAKPSHLTLGGQHG